MKDAKCERVDGRLRCRIGWKKVGVGILQDICDGIGLEDVRGLWSS